MMFRRRTSCPTSTAPRARFLRSGIAAGIATVIALLSGCDDGGSSGPLGALRSGLKGASGGAVVELDLSHGLSERAGQLGLFSASTPSLADLVQVLNKIEADDRAKAILLRLGNTALSWAQTEELSRRLAELRLERAVICHSHSYSNATLLLALRGCNRIWLSPAGEVGTVGIAGQMLYVKRLLDRFKIEADFVHMGRYKSAAETLTQDGPSEEARESLDAVLESIRSTWLEGLASAGRAPDITVAAEHGPWSPEAALERGMIDAVGYLSQARDEAKARAGAEHVEKVFGQGARGDAAAEIAQLIRWIAGSSPPEKSVEHVAVVTAVGGIDMEPSGPLGGDGIHAEPLGKTLRRLRENDAVKAVVLRIDSPGGSALASDLLWHELMRLREKKPLIASLAETAASGGYYMACAANSIVAERTTILGSIGVVGGKIVIGDALDELGVTGVTFPASDEPGAAQRAAYLSLLTPWDEATRERVRQQMAGIYELFLRRVAEGRGLELDQVRAVAEGRIWTGVHGMQRQLIDAYGGLTEAIALAKERAGMPKDAPVRIESAPEGLLQLLEIEEDADDVTIRAAIERASARPAPLAGVAAEFRPYAESLLPLLGRERVVVALPFALKLD